MCSKILFKRDSTTESDKEFFNRRFKRLCDSNIDSDIEFLIGRNRVSFSGHKLIFSMASEVFYEMFHGELKNASVVELITLGPKGFEAMKQFIYTGEVNFETYGIAVSAFLISKEYRIPQLDLEAMKYFEEVTFPSSEIFEFHGYIKRFPKLSSSDLERECIKIIAERLYELLDCDNLLSAELTTIDLILGLESLALSSELELFILIEKWALAEANRRMILVTDMNFCFNDLKKKIRFLTMTSKEFASRASKSLLLSDEEKLAIALNLMDFGSTPYPDHLCPIEKNRNFTRATGTWNQL